MAKAEDVYGAYGSVPDKTAVTGSGAEPLRLQASPADFGAAIGQGVSNLGNTGQELAQHYQEMAVHTATNDAYVNGYAPAVNNLVSQYKQLSGTDALQQLPAYQQQLSDLNKQYLNMGSPMQKELMGQLVSRHTISTMDNMSNHADTQYAQHEATVNTQAIKTASDEAANNWKNPDMVDWNVFKARKDSTLFYSNKIGHDADSQPVVDQMAKEEGSKVVTAAINMAMDSGDYKTANMYKDKYSDILSGRDKLNIEKSTSSLSIADNARGFVDNLLTGRPAISPNTSHYSDMETKASVADMAQKNGFDPNIAFALHGTESNFGAGITAKSARQDAFQTAPDLRDKGFEGDDLASSAHNAFKIWNNNSSDLAKRTGAEPTPSQGYLAYNQGGLGAATLLKAEPTETAVQALSKIMSPKAAMAHVADNGGTPTMAASDFANLVESKFNNFYESQKVTATGDVADAIRNQSKIQLPAIQNTANAHDLFNQINDRLPAAQAAVDNIPDDKVRDAASKQLKLQYEQAKLGDSAWKNSQAKNAQDIAQNSRYTSMDQVPQTVKNDLQAAGQLKFLENSLTDKNNPKKDNAYGAGFLPTLQRLTSSDETDRIPDLAGLQKEYGDRTDLHSSGFRQLANMLKSVDTPEGQAKAASQAQFLTDLRQKMVAGESDTEGKANFEKALPLFFNSYNSAAAGKEDLENTMSLDPSNPKSFVAMNKINVPTPAQMTSKKIETSVSAISELFGTGSNQLVYHPPVAGSAPMSTTPTLQKGAQILKDYDAGRITEQQKDDQLKVIGAAKSITVPRPE